METNNIYQLTESLKQNIDWLNLIMLGDNTQSVTIEGVERPTISKEFSDRFFAFNVLIQGRQAFETLASLVAAGAPPADKRLAEVWKDGSNNGLYGWDGTKWIRSDYDLYQQVKRLSDAQANMWYQDMGPGSALYEINRPMLVSAIKDVRCNQLKNPGASHYLWILASNDVVYKDRMYWRDGQGEMYRLTPEIRPSGWESGPVWVRCHHESDVDSYLDALIDYRQLSDGVLWNGQPNAFGLSNAWLHFGVQFQAQANQSALHKGSVYPDLTLFVPSERHERQWMPHIESHAFNVDRVCHPYVLQTFAIADAAYGTMMSIADGEGRLYVNDKSVPNLSEGSLERFRCYGDGGFIDVMVNVAAIQAVANLPTLLWNTKAPKIVFSASEGTNSGSRELAMAADFPMVDLRRSKITSQTLREIGQAVQSANVVIGEGLSIDDLYIQVFTRQSPDFGDSIWLCTKESRVGALSGVASLDGPTDIVVSGTESGQLVKVSMVIDWSLVSATGTLINGNPAVAPIALKTDKSGQDQARRAVTRHEESFHVAQWLAPSSSQHPDWDSFAAFLALQVKGFYLTGTREGVTYGIGIITKNSLAFGTSVSVFDNAKRIVARGKATEPNANGETVFELLPVGDGPSGKLWMDMTPLDDGTIENRNQPRLLLNPEYVEIRAVPEMIKLPAVKPDAGRYIRQAIRLACMGSSITWGAGYVGQGSFVGVAEDYLRQTCATTLLGSELGSLVRLAEPMQYKGDIGQLSGVGQSVRFTLEGDEVSLAICKERGNHHAAVVEMWINGALHTRFTTYNDLPYAENVFKGFPGDGETRSWDLGQAFTFNHRVTLDGAPLTGGIYRGGFGGTFPAGWDYMVVRRVVETGGEHRVTHWLTLRTSPPASSQVQCVFDQGETIKPMRSTVANTERGVGSPLESTYGDGAIAYDPANPVGLSSGLDFRYSDDRAVVTASFDVVQVLDVELKIIGSDPRVSNPLEPRLYLGFVTNKMHHIMNAGIGGFKASNFIDSYDSLKSHYKVSQWRPTHVTLESGTNDDWGTNEYLCWQDVTLSQEALFNIDSLVWLQDIVRNQDLSYQVSDSRIGYADIGPFHVTLNADTTHIGNIQPGDVVTFGLWKGDNRTVATRLVSRWDPETRTIHWGPALRLDDFGWKMSALSEIEVVQVKSIRAWQSNVETVLDSLQDANPDADLSIATCGVPNMRIRRLEGYTPCGKALARARGIGFIDYYAVTRYWAEHAPSDTPVYLNAAGSQTTDGSSELLLYQAGGAPLTTRWTLRGWSVKVNGVERYLDGCYVIGGARRGWTNPDAELTMSNYTWVYDQFKVVFTRDIPVQGDQVEVTFSSQQWAADDCHPKTIGHALFGQALSEYLRKVI